MNEKGWWLVAGILVVLLSIWIIGKAGLTGQSVLDTSFDSGNAYQPLSSPPGIGIMGIVPNTVFINSSSGNNRSSDDLFCWANSTDTGGNDVSYYGFWYKNGIRQYSLSWSAGSDIMDMDIIGNESIIALRNYMDSLYLDKYWLNGSLAWEKDINMLANDNPIEDIANGYMIWLTKEQSRKVGRVGSKVTVTIGGKRFTGEVIGGPHGGRWGRYSTRLKKILLDTRVGEKLSRVEIVRLHRQALAMKGRR